MNDLTEQAFTLPLPPSANRYWRNWRGRMVISSEARKYKEQVSKVLAEQGAVCLGDGPVAILMRVFRKIKSGDLDNRIKVVLDSLRGIVYQDDKQVVEIHAFRHDDRDNPRVEIQIASKDKPATT